MEPTEQQGQQGEQEEAEPAQEQVEQDEGQEPQASSMYMALRFPQQQPDLIYSVQQEYAGEGMGV